MSRSGFCKGLICPIACFLRWQPLFDSRTLQDYLLVIGLRSTNGTFWIYWNSAWFPLGVSWECQATAWCGTVETLGCADFGKWSPPSSVTITKFLVITLNFLLLVFIGDKIFRNSKTKTVQHETQSQSQVGKPRVLKHQPLTHKPR